VVLFEMLTGRLPFHREHRGALSHAILTDPVPQMPGVPDDLRRVVTKALAKDPAERWQSAHAMARALKGEPDTALSDDQPTRTIIGSAPQPRRRWSLIAAAAAIVLLAVAASAFYLWRARDAGIPLQKHIAMLPLSPDKASAIENGVDDALTAALASQPNVTVVTSNELRRGSIKTVEAARKYHGVNLALTWSAKPEGDKVEFAIDLVDAAHAKTVAQRKLVYDPKNPIASRDQAVTTVFRMLKLEAPPVAARTADTAPSDAYSSYLEGRGYLTRYDIAANTDKAIDSFSRSIRLDSHYTLAYAGLAEAYWRKALSSKDSKWMSLATQNAEHATRLDPNLAAAHAVLGSVYRDSGHQPEAILEFQRALGLAPNNAEATRQLAQIYGKLGRTAEAEELYVRSTKARPTDWTGFMLLGLFYYERERYDEAVAALSEAKSLAADNDLIRHNLGLVYRAQGRYAEALREIQQALAIRPNAGLYAILGATYYRQHRFAEAVNALETAIELNSNIYSYWGNLGIYCRRAAGSESKSLPALRHALELAEKVLKDDPTNYSTRASVAEYRARLGDTKGALSELENIPEVARGPLTSRFAIVYELSGKRGEAVAIVRKNLTTPASLNQIKDDPDLAEVWRALR
jgi:serine/threonine-protein kinase